MDWAARIDTMMAGYRDAMILAHAVKAGLCEALADGPRSSAEVAAARGLDERATDVVLCALAAAGLLRKDGESFALEPGAAPFLVAGGGQTMTSIIGHNLSLMRRWLRLDEVLRSGEPVARGEPASGGSRTQVHRDDELRDFICGMANISRQSSREVAARIDLGGVSRLLDLGGGPATASIVFCGVYPRLRCEVFDLPEAAAIGAAEVAAAGLSDRITVRAGDFLTDELGGGFDAVYISNIVHMLGPDDTQLVLEKARRALVAGGRVLVKDFFLDDDRVSPAWAAQFSVNMLVGTRRGKSYPRREMLDLLRAAGFADPDIVGIGRHSQVLVARRES